ncbi:hypothetical protein [Rhodococcus sp. NPDC058521]|uniref:hypothetical protein n=1 Tax=Rhodococcus sp. NPDC058521 TaxID=3346536 RepID=UPI003652A2BE
MSKYDVIPRELVTDVPGLGTTWVERGTMYWMRRALLVLFTVGMLVLVVFFIIAVLGGILSSVGLVARVVVSTVAGIAIVASCFYGLRSLRQKNADISAVVAGNEALSTTAGRTGKPSVSGLGVGALAGGGSALAGGLLLIGGLCGVGWFLAMALGSFGRYANLEEAAAKTKLERWRADQSDA